MCWSLGGQAWGHLYIFQLCLFVDSWLLSTQGTEHNPPPRIRKLLADEKVQVNPVYVRACIGIYIHRCRESHTFIHKSSMLILVRSLSWDHWEHLWLNYGSSPLDHCVDGWRGKCINKLKITRSVSVRLNVLLNEKHELRNLFMRHNQWKWYFPEGLMHSNSSNLEGRIEILAQPKSHSFN